MRQIVSYWYVRKIGVLVSELVGYVREKGGYVGETGVLIGKWIATRERRVMEKDVLIREVVGYVRERVAMRGRRVSK